MRSLRKHLAITLPIIISIIVLDQVTKLWAVANVKGQGVIKVIGDFMIYMFAENRGAFLSMGHELPDFLWIILMAVVPAIFLVVLLVIVLRNRKLPMTETIIFSGIIAGGLSNLYDRIMYGYVIDFIHFDTGIGFLKTGILNIADIPITLGVIYLLFYYLVKDIINKRSKSIEQ